MFTVSWPTACLAALALFVALNLGGTTFRTVSDESDLRCSSPDRVLVGWCSAFGVWAFGKKGCVDAVGV